MHVLITSGTGTVGKELTKRIIEAGHVPVVMGHSPDKLLTLPQGARGVLGNFNEPKTWEGIFGGIDKLCLITPAMPDEGAKGAAFAKAAYEAGVEQIVFLGIHNVHTAPHVPHFKSKIEIKEVLKKSGKPFTVIEANNFFQNDFFFLPMVKSTHQYLQPLGQKGLSRVDVRDIADAFVNALLNSKHHYQCYPLVGAEPINTHKTEQLLSKLTGTIVTCPQNSMDAWDRFITPYIPGWLKDDWTQMYLHFIANGLVASPMDLIQQEKILGRSPRKYEEFLKENL